MSADEYPVTVEHDGNIKLKIEKMAPDTLYHCIQEGIVFLFFLDDAGLLNCYEVNDPETVSEITNNPSQIESILTRRSKE